MSHSQLKSVGVLKGFPVYEVVDRPTRCYYQFLTSVARFAGEADENHDMPYMVTELAEYSAERNCITEADIGVRTPYMLLCQDAEEDECGILATLGILGEGTHVLYLTHEGYTYLMCIHLGQDAVQATGVYNIVVCPDPLNPDSTIATEEATKLLSLLHTKETKNNVND